MTGIPEILREFIRPDEDDDTSIRLPARDGRRIGMLTIPDIQFIAWKTFFPKDMEKGPQSRYRQSRRVFFAIDDLPADAPTSISTGEASVFFSGHPDPIPAGEWIGNPPAELPAVSYADITRLLGTSAPKSQPADPQEPAASSEGRPDGSGIPQEMKNANQWLVWKHEVRDEKKTKIPLNPKTGGFTSAPEATWSYEECKEAADRRGIGIGFSLKNGFVGIDYDHVLDSEGNLKPEYAGLTEEIKALNSYTEVSPSGEGLHVFVRCEDIPPECKAGKHTERGEMYSSGRFFTVTGNTWEKSPSPNISIILAEVYRRVYNRIAGIPIESAAQPAAIQPTTPQKRPTISDSEAFCRINRTEKGRALWNGDTSGYESTSEADAALMVMLADITGGDASRMKQLFLSSGLGKREKARRDDYINRTIESACEYVIKIKNKKQAPTQPAETARGTPQGYNWQSKAANQACREMAGKLPDIRRAGDGIYVIIDPNDGLTKLVSSGDDEPFRRWCHQVFTEHGYDSKFAYVVFENIAVLHTADPIQPIDIEKAITAIPCKSGGYISLKDGKRCERPAEMEFCPFVLNLPAEEAEYDPNYQPTGRVFSDLMTYLGSPSVRYLISVIAASIPRIPANRRVIILTGPPRSSKTTFGKVLGELGLAPAPNIDFSSEIDNKGRYRPELATHIPKYPILFINDPTDPDGNAVKKLCDITQQYEQKYKNTGSVYQRASCVLTMNHPPDFKTSAMESKVFFICSQCSYAGEEIPDDEYLETIRADGSLRDIWQEVIHQGLRNNWKIRIPPECEEHNRMMQIGAAPLQKWLSACKPAPATTENFHQMQEIYANYMTAVNPDADPQQLTAALEKFKYAPTWMPSTKRDGLEGKSKNEVRKNLLANGFTRGRVDNQQGFYIYLPDIKNEMFLPSLEYQSPEPIDKGEAWMIIRETKQKFLI